MPPRVVIIPPRVPKDKDEQQINIFKLKKQPNDATTRAEVPANSFSDSPVIWYRKSDMFKEVSSKDNGYLFVAETGGAGDCMFYSIATALVSMGLITGGTRYENMMKVRELTACQITGLNVYPFVHEQSVAGSPKNRSKIMRVLRGIWNQSRERKVDEIRLPSDTGPRPMTDAERHAHASNYYDLSRMSAAVSALVRRSNTLWGDFGILTFLMTHPLMVENKIGILIVQASFDTVTCGPMDQFGRQTPKLDDNNRWVDTFERLTERYIVLYYTDAMHFQLVGWSPDDSQVTKKLLYFNRGTIPGALDALWARHCSRTEEYETFQKLGQVGIPIEPPHAWITPKNGDFSLYDPDAFEKMFNTESEIADQNGIESLTEADTVVDEPELGAREKENELNRLLIQCILEEEELERKQIDASMKLAMKLERQYKRKR